MAEEEEKRRREEEKQRRKASRGKSRHSEAGTTTNSVAGSKVLVRFNPKPRTPNPLTLDAPRIQPNP